MTKFEKCIVYENKIYCWDEKDQKPIEVELKQKDTIEKIPDEALKLLFTKLFGIKGSK